jgi:hypothetical protein
MTEYEGVYNNYLWWTENLGTYSNVTDGIWIITT